MVVDAKYAISFGSRHGKPPFRPIPLDLVAATITVSRGMFGGVAGVERGRSGGGGESEAVRAHPGLVLE